jgi:hypothetical protein
LLSNASVLSLNWLVSNRGDVFRCVPNVVLCDEQLKGLDPVATLVGVPIKLSWRWRIKLSRYNLRLFISSILFLREATYAIDGMDKHLSNDVAPSWSDCSTQPYVCVDQIGQSRTRLNVLHSDAVQRHNRPSGDQLAEESTNSIIARVLVY